MRKLLFLLIASLGFSANLYASNMQHIELIIFRQAGVAPVFSSSHAPDNWHADSEPLKPEQTRSSLLDLSIAKLQQSNDYQIIFHRAWQQAKSGRFVNVALNSGEQVFAHFPVEGTFKIRQDRANEVELDFWINSFQADGNLDQSEHFKHSAIIPYNELSFIDFGSLGALIRVLPQ